MRTERVNPGNIRTRKRVPIDISSHLNRGMPQLLLHVQKTRAVLNQVRSKRMPQGMESDGTEARCLQARPKIPMVKVCPMIRDRVRSGLAAARVRGKQLGRPRVTVDGFRIAELRAEGRGWKAIAAELGVGVGTILRAAEQSESGFKKPL